MTTYYVDYATGDDTANGTATGTPWEHCPGDPRATSNADITLSAGDTVVFKGGSTYSFDAAGDDDYIEANASGTSGNVITYISGHVHSSSWGTGRAVIDGANADPSFPDHTGVFGLKNYSYITVQGLEVKNQAAVNSDVVGLIAWKTSGGDPGGNVIIDNNMVHNSFGGGIIIQGTSPSDAATNFIIRNNDITLTNYHGLMIRYGVDDVLIETNSFDLNGVQVYAGDVAGNNIALAYDAPGGGGTVQTNVIIRGNDFDDTANVNPSYTPSKSHILFQENTTGAIVEDNFFHGEPSYSSIDFAGPQTDITIRNNVFNVYPTTWQGALSFETDQGASVSYSGIDIFNNTFVSEPGANRGIIFFGDGNSTQSPMFTDVDIRNNIIDLDTDTSQYLVYIDTEAAAPVVQLSTLTIDYNAYQTGKADNYFFSDGTTYNFTTWKSYLSGESVIGADANSTFGQVAFVDEAGDDFKLTSGDTKALNLGGTLSTFSDDKDGVSRPQGGVWDIGAYEYQISANQYFISAGIQPIDNSSGATAQSYYISAGLIPDDLVVTAGISVMREHFIMGIIPWQYGQHDMGFIRTDWGSVVTVVVFSGSVADGINFGDIRINIATLLNTLTDGTLFSDISSANAVFVSAVVDGSIFGDTSVSQITLLVSLTDGIIFGDTLTAVSTLLSSQSDGVKFGDSSTRIATLLSSATDGVVFSDAPITIAILLNTIADGIRLGDTTSSQIVILVSLVDGVTVGDTTTNIANLLNTLSDGVNFGDTLVSIATLLGSITDGTKFGDVSVGNAIMLTSVVDGTKFSDIIDGDVALLVSMTDGVRFGDNTSTIASLLGNMSDGILLEDTPTVIATLLGSIADGTRFEDAAIGDIIILVSVSDGLSLGDTSTTIADFSTTLTDGIDMGDIPVSVASLIASLIDGVKLGDTIGRGLTIDVSLDDGTKYGDTASALATLNVSIVDSVNFSDTVTNIATIMASITDGMTFSDVILAVGGLVASGEVTASFTVKGATITFTVKCPGTDFTV